LCQQITGTKTIVLKGQNTMTTRFNLSILIAMIAALLVTNTHAATLSSETRSVFIADYSDGQFTGAMLALDGDSVQPITFMVTSGENHEDLFPAYGATITAEVELNDRGYTGKMRMFSTEYQSMIDLSYTAYTDDSHIVGYIESKDGFSIGTMDGEFAQFRGFIQNGSVVKLRNADAYSTHGTGWLVQNSNLISYTVSNGESTTHTILLPLIML
jgi:hypothetical protein